MNFGFNQNCLLLLLFNNSKYTLIRSIAIDVHFYVQMLHVGVIECKREKNTVHLFSQKLQVKTVLSEKGNGFLIETSRISF